MKNASKTELVCERIVAFDSYKRTEEIPIGFDYRKARREANKERLENPNSQYPIV